VKAALNGCYENCLQVMLAQQIPYFMDYKTLWTIRRTLIFKLFFKKITFLPFLLLDCNARLKKNS
jgi:hypothetical protein